ncbi:MAG: 16S rRNA (guanine(527)-N(7))-methyltransferase RsmG [Elusimicrobiota bacterium]|jgi:16S rRNA (guanine527-N7)-methyltransferase
MNPELREQMRAVLEGWGLSLDEEQRTLLDNYSRDVLEYNRRVNLTAAREESEIVRRHLLDALAGVPVLRKHSPASPKIADVGAGGGFLGICLKIAWPQAEVTLIESVYRKYRFLNWSAMRLGLRGLRVLHARAGTQRGFDVVTARAVAPLPELLPWALPMGRRLALWQSEAASEPGNAQVLREKGARVEEDHPYRLPGEERDRHIVIVQQESAS